MRQSNAKILLYKNPLHRFKAERRALWPADIRLFTQRDDTHRQPGERGSTARDGTCGFPVILSRAFHTGIGMHQTALIVINRHARGIMGAASQ